MIRRAAMLLLAAWMQPAMAQHAGGLDIDMRDHTEFSRVVVSLPASIAAAGVPLARRQGDGLILALPGAGAVAVMPGLTVRHVLGVQGGQDQLRLNLQPGSTTRVRRMGRRIVVDVYGPDPRTAVTPRPQAAAPKPAPAQAVPTAPMVAKAGPAMPPPVPLTGAAQDTDPVEGSEALRATRIAGQPDTILLPFDAQVGAAAFAQAGAGRVVFDQSKAIDLAALKDDPVFGGARITLSPAVTLLSMPVPRGRHISLRRQPEGWAVAVLPGEPNPPAAPVRLRGGTVVIAMKQAAGVAVLVDPLSGSKLLVGTVHDHGPAIVVPHVSAEFRLLPSWEGVVVGVISDRLALSADAGGFALRSAGGSPLAALMSDSDQAAVETVGSLTQRFDIPAGDQATLGRRLGVDVAAAARAPRQARFRPRLRAVRDMLALGMDREAACLLGIARKDDPSQESRPEIPALQAMAGWLAAPAGDAPKGAGAIDNSALGAADEVALWRALMPPREAGASMAARAAVLAADWRLLAGYPAPLRRRLMPLAAAILIEGRALPAAEALLGAAGSPPMDGPRAQLLAAQGRLADALAVLDRLASGLDRKEAAYALRDATEMRLLAGALSPAQAAHLLGARLFAWRDPEFELDRRLRIAALLGQAGDFRSALDGLREADRLFPEAHARVRAAEDQAIGALVHGGAGAALAPLDLLALAADNADLLGQSEAASSLTPMLLDKLTALDLPDRADVLVGKLIANTPDPLSRARLGERQAELRMEQNDAPGALAALDQTMAAGLPEEVEARRAVARARALAQLGQNAPALSLLAAHDTAESWALAAQLHEKARDWHAAVRDLQKLIRAGVPDTGALLPAQQDLVLRLASAASQAGDGATLRALSAAESRRISAGPRAALFAALTAEPVRDLSDLPRSAQEANAARALPAALAGYTAH